MGGIPMKRVLIVIVLFSFVFINFSKGNAQYAIINDYRLPSYSSIFSPNSFYASSDLLSLYRIAQSYYDPSTSSDQPITSFLNGFYNPESLSYQYNNPSVNVNSPLSLIASLSAGLTNSFLSQGEYYFPSFNNTNYLTSVASRAPAANFYYPTTMSAFPFGNLGNYVVNSPFSPFTPFFSGPQVQSYATVNGNLINLPGIGIRTVNTVTSLVMANAVKGMYCWDPLPWLEAGFQVGIWEVDSELPVRAQFLDNRGHLIDTAATFSVQPTGQIGTMTLLRPDVHIFQGMVGARASNDYVATVTANNVSTAAIIHRRSATCDVCHPEPPGHIASSYTWGNCDECHPLDNVLHVHAYNAQIPIDDCYRCHPSGCLSGLHGQLGLWCTNCHGNLADAVNNQMKITGQRGKPYCADCHDLLHSENVPELYMNSVGHGGVSCINCHAPTHKQTIQAFGYNPLGANHCEACHTVQASISWMGPNCGICHGSSISPHLVNR